MTGPIKAGSPEAHARALKAAATRKRNIREGVTLKGGVAPKKKKSEKPKKEGTPKQRQLAAEIKRLYRQYHDISSFTKDRALQEKKRRLYGEIRDREMRLDRLNHIFARKQSNSQFEYYQRNVNPRQK